MWGRESLTANDNDVISVSLKIIRAPSSGRGRRAKRGAFVLLTKAPYPPLTRSPFPMRGRLVWRRLRRLFYWRDARKRLFSHQSLVTSTIRGKESSHMRGMRFFGSVPICSGWGFSHIERFRPFRMTIRGSGRVFIWEIHCVFWN